MQFWHISWTICGNCWVPHRPVGLPCRNRVCRGCRSSKKYQSLYRFSWIWAAGWMNRTTRSSHHPLLARNLCSNSTSWPWWWQSERTFLWREWTYWLAQGRVNRRIDLSPCFAAGWSWLWFPWKRGPSQWTPLLRDIYWRVIRSQSVLTVWEGSKLSLEISNIKISWSNLTINSNVV